MFRKPKRSAKASLRKRNRKSTNDDEDIPNPAFGTIKKSNASDDEENIILRPSHLSEKRRKVQNNISKTLKGTKAISSSLIHQYNSSKEKIPTAQELATREAEHHPEESSNISPAVKKIKEAEETNGTKIYTGAKKETNKFHAGPLKAPTFIRTTCRFDYQPDICKDYKETGFCGFGDTCIYLHDRGDTLSGWQLEKEWEERKKRELEAKEKEMNNFIQSTTNTIGTKSGSDDQIEEKKYVLDVKDGIPYACHLCRGPFRDPVVTSCMHYFCEKCIMEEFKTNPACPICKKDTHGVFNFPTKLVSKKKKVVGSRGGWEEYFNAMLASNGKQ